MSNFTNANLILTKHMAIAVEHVDPTWVMEEHNDKWAYILTPSDGQYPETLSDFSDKLVALSHKTPVMYYYDQEDHGLGYRLLYQGQMIAVYDLSFEFEDELPLRLMEAFKEQFGVERFFDKMEDDPDFFEHQAPLKKRDYLAHVAEQANLPALKHLELSDEVIQQIEGLMNPLNAPGMDGFLTAHIPNMTEDYQAEYEEYTGLGWIYLAEQLREVLGLVEFEWISWDYHHNQ